MKELASIVSALPVSTALTVDLRLKALKKLGMDVISFCVGEPDFPTPATVCEAGIRAIERGDTKYTNASGAPALKAAVAAAMLRDYGLSYTSGEIAVTTGAKYAVYAAVRAMVDPGDEVILPAPYWTSYYHIVRLAQGEPKVIRCGVENGWKLTPDQLEKAVTPRTKALILNNPNNPTGAVYTREELMSLAAVCRTYDLYVISDEIYSRLLYTPEPFCAAASLDADMHNRTVTVNGVSKAYAMTGWRIGFAASGNADVMRAVSALLSHTTGSPNTIAQAAAENALLGDQDACGRMREAFLRRRDVMTQALTGISGVRFTVPQGAFYVLLDIRALLEDGEYADEADFALRLLEAEGVATVPCADFGAPGHIRLCYALDETRILEGVQRLKRFVDSGVKAHA